MSNFAGNGGTIGQVSAGIPGTAPNIYTASTVDSLATITAVGYLNDIQPRYGLKLNDYFFINYSDTSTFPLGEASTLGFFVVVVAGANYSLSQESVSGALLLTGGTLTGNLTMGNGTFILDSASNALTAHAGGTQAAALALTNMVNRVTTVATAGDSVKLPASVAGMAIAVINNGANVMQVFGAGTDTINGVATATGVPQQPNSAVLYYSAVAGLWQAIGLPFGYSGAFATVSSSNGLTAHAGGTQAAALPLVSAINNVTTVATAGDSVLLPASAAGMEITVTNNGVASMQVYGAGTDTINGVATATGVAQLPGQTVVYTAAVAGNWLANVSTNPNPVLFASVPVTAAQFNGAYAAPFALVAAPGANKLISVEKMELIMTYGSAAFASGGAVFAQYDSTASGAGVAATNTEAAADFFATASTTYQFIGVSGNTVGALPFSTTVNKGLYLSNATGAFTTGTGSAFVVKVYYRIVNTVGAL